MEAEERPSKLRKLGHAPSETEEAAVQLLTEPKTDSSKETWDLATRKGEDSDAHSDTDTAEASDGRQSVRADADARPAGMSKNAWKKIQKKAEWEAGREYRKVKRKEKIQAKRERDRKTKAEAREKEKARDMVDETATTSRTPKHTRLPVTILIDCGFDDLMTESERISLGSQLTRSYSDNNRAPFQAHLIVSSWGGLLKERFDTVLAKHHQNWRGVVFIEKDFVEAIKIAEEAMKGPRGGQLAGIFSRYVSSEQQPETGSAQVDAQLQDVNGHGDVELVEEARPEHSVQVEGHIHNQDVAFSSATAPTAGDLELDGAVQRSAKTSSIFNGSHPDHGPPPLTGSDQSSTNAGGNGLPDSEVIYLTSDSPHTLDKLRPYSTYIIGGLVDKNRHKGICYKTACERGLKTAKLPIGDFMAMQSRFVLATNHVVEIMVRWLECGDWGKAFLDVIPKRKGGKLKEADTAEESVEQENDDFADSDHR